MQVDGYAKPEHKKFKTKVEAENFIAALQPLENAPCKRRAAQDVEVSASK